MVRSSTPKSKAGDVQALFEFGYDEKLGSVDRGQVFKLAGHINDGKLVELRYVAPVKTGTELSECGECGRLFIDEGTRAAHGDLWHGAECADCGWIASRVVADRVAALKEHRRRCSAYKSRRDGERKTHIKEVKEIKAPEPVAVS
jgi:hypothetical protein